MRWLLQRVLSRLPSAALEAWDCVFRKHVWRQVPWEREDQRFSSCFSSCHTSVKLAFPLTALELWTSQCLSYLSSDFLRSSKIVCHGGLSASSWTCSLVKCCRSHVFLYLKIIWIQLCYLSCNRRNRYRPPTSDWGNIVKIITYFM